MPLDPTISIAIAAYNRGPAIARTLDSVLAQTRPALEVIVVDDGSTDDTAAFVRAAYPHVRLVEAPHGGQSAARNRGAEEARGDVVVHFDSDDLMHPHALETFADLFRTFPEARAAFTDHRYENTATGEVWENHHRRLPQFDRLWNRTRPVREAGDSRLYDRRLYYTLLSGNLLQQPWAVYRDTFLKLGGFDVRLRNNEDWELFLRLTRAAPVALSDRVTSTHVVEKGRAHVHQSAGLDENNVRALRGQLAATGWDFRARGIIHRALASYHKKFGDQAASGGNWRRAWGQYFRSFARWPFDHVVAARLLLWLPRLLARSPKDGPLNPTAAQATHGGTA